MDRWKDNEDTFMAAGDLFIGTVSGGGRLFRFLAAIA